MLPDRLPDRRIAEPIARPPDFIGIYPVTEFSADIIIAEILMDKGLPVDIRSDAKDTFGRPMPGFLAVHGDSRVRGMQHTLLSTPEGKALGKLGNDDLPKFEGCDNWDVILKRRLTALHYHLSAERLRASAEAIQEPTQGHFALAIQSRSTEQRSIDLLKPRGLFGMGKRLTLPDRDEIKELMERAAETEYPLLALAQNAKQI